VVEVGELHARKVTSGRCDDVRVDGYDDRTYGRAFADVYDAWYQGVSDVGATVAALDAMAARAACPRVLELGAGTGRLAIPLAATGLEVHAVDASPEMLARLAASDVDDRVRATIGDMVDDLPDGPFGVVVVAYNTLFNLRSEQRQQACFAAVAQRLAADGVFVVEAFVPDAREGDDVAVRTLTADRVVLSVSRHDPARQLAEGHFVELSEAGGVRLRPWAIRWSTPAELDAMATAAGLELRSRWSDFGGAPFAGDSVTHVSTYARSSVHVRDGD
jgi:SAM-dependent methyltransferase